MDKMLKKIAVFAISIITILTLFACTVNTEEHGTVEETSTARSANVEVADAKGFATNSSYKVAANTMGADGDFVSFDLGLSQTYDKKLVKTVDITAETKTFDETLNWFESHVEKFDGTIESSSLDFGNMESEDYRKSAYYLVRVPADKLDSFMGFIGDKLNITYKYENIHDVTEEYDDTESRIATLKIEEEKLNDLMKKAKTVEDIIKVEDKLS